MSDIAVGVMFKDRLIYVLEWVFHYRLIGFSRFYLWDNATECDPHARAILEAIPGVTYQHFPVVGGGTEAHNAIFQQARKDGCRWLALNDLDEFLFPLIDNNVPTILKTFEDENIGGLVVVGTHFGTSGHEKRPLGLQTDNYTMRTPYSFDGARFGKSIVRPTRVTKILNPAVALYSPPYYAVNTRGERVPNDIIPLGLRSFKLLRHNHYYTRSKEDFEDKLTKGCQTLLEKPAWVRNVLPIVERAATVFDDSASQRFEDILRREIDSFLCDFKGQVPEGFLCSLVDSVGIYKMVPPRRSLLSQWRVDRLLKFLYAAPAGLVVEVGVYKGGTLHCLASHFTQRKFFGFDTFKGLPPQGKFDNAHREGDFGDVNPEEIEKYFSDLSNVKLVKGLYPDSDVLLVGDQIALAHVDVDLYESTYRSLVHLAPHMVKGGRIYCDDALWPQCEGATLACCRFASEFNMVPKLELKEHFLYFQF